jgi:hypothetical protein
LPSALREPFIGVHSRPFAVTFWLRPKPPVPSAVNWPAPFGFA